MNIIKSALKPRFLFALTVFIGIMLLSSCETEPSNTNNNSNNNSSKSYLGTWEWDNLAAYTFNDTNLQYCDSMPYEVYSNHTTTTLNLIIDTGSVQWIDLTKTIRTAPNRPLSCGGPLSETTTDDDSWNGLIVNKKENEILVSYDQNENYTFTFSNITDNQMTVTMRDEYDSSVVFTHLFNRKK